MFGKWHGMLYGVQKREIRELMLRNFRFQAKNVRIKKKRLYGSMKVVKNYGWGIFMIIIIIIYMHMYDFVSVRFLSVCHNVKSCN